MTDTEQLGLYEYTEQRRMLEDRLLHVFAMKTSGRVHRSRDHSVLYVQYSQTDESPQLILWAIPAVDSILEGLPIRARFERQRRSIVDRGRQGAPIGYHGLLALPTGDHVLTPGCLETADIALRGNDELYVNNQRDVEGRAQFDQFRERIFSESPEQVYKRVKDGYFLV